MLTVIGILAISTASSDYAEVQLRWVPVSLIVMLMVMLVPVKQIGRSSTFLLGLCLLAFHQHLSFAQLVVVQVGAGMLGNVAPVPGGIGVQEAALTAGLTSFGIPANAALATVLVFRAITFAIPPIFGFFTLRWLRSRGYA